VAESSRKPCSKSMMLSNDEPDPEWVLAIANRDAKD
jgi:hypothetical protein